MQKLLTKDSTIKYAVLINEEYMGTISSRFDLESMLETSVGDDVLSSEWIEENVLIMPLLSEPFAPFTEVTKEIGVTFDDGFESDKWVIEQTGEEFDSEEDLRDHIREEISEGRMTAEEAEMLDIEHVMTVPHTVSVEVRDVTVEVYGLRTKMTDFGTFESDNFERETVWRVAEDDIRGVMEESYGYLTEEDCNEIVEKARNHFHCKKWTDDVMLFIDSNHDLSKYMDEEDAEQDAKEDTKDATPQDEHFTIVTQEDAMKYVGLGVEVYKLYDDGSEALIDAQSYHSAVLDILEHKEHGGRFGIE